MRKYVQTELKFRITQSTYNTKREGNVRIVLFVAITIPWPLLLIKEKTQWIYSGLVVVASSGSQLALWVELPCWPASPMKPKRATAVAVLVAVGVIAVPVRRPVHRPVRRVAAGPNAVSATSRGPNATSLRLPNVASPGPSLAASRMDRLHPKVHLRPHRLKRHRHHRRLLSTAVRAPDGFVSVS